MIHGYITKEGTLVLESANPTDQFALRCWFEQYKKGDGTVALLIQPEKDDDR